MSSRNLKIIDSNTIQVFTYEKGIEDIMLSCGSGSVASAFYAFHKEKINSPLSIINKGGNMTLEFDSKWENVWLRSHPKILFESSINIS